MTNKDKRKKRTSGYMYIRNKTKRYKPPTCPTDAWSILEEKRIARRYRYKTFHIITYWIKFLNQPNLGLSISDILREGISYKFKLKNKPRHYGRKI